VRGADIVGEGDNDRSVSLVRGSLPCRLTVGGWARHHGMAGARLKSG
jgi:hypothetical protein